MTDELLVEIRDLLKEMLELERASAHKQEEMKGELAKAMVTQRKVQKVALVIVVLLLAYLAYSAFA